MATKYIYSKFWRLWRKYVKHDHSRIALSPLQHPDTYTLQMRATVNVVAKLVRHDPPTAAACMVTDEILLYV